MPSLDVGDPATFHLVNRPHEALTFEKMLSGLIAFRQHFHGRYWLEVLLVGAFTDFEPELAAIRTCVGQIAPDRVLLGTVTRPPAEDFALAVPHERLLEMAAAFSPPAEVLESLHDSTLAQHSCASREDILGLLARRPCTIDDIATGLRMHRVEVLKYVESMVAEGLIELRAGGKEQVYRVGRSS